jgi:putative transposase
LRIELAIEAAPRLGIAPACHALNISAASFYRYRRNLQNTPQTCPKPEAAERHLPAGRALSPEERARVLSELMSERFMDLAPRQVYATLVEEGTYLCSIRTMYRLLASEQAVRERRSVRRGGKYSKPELLAVRIKEVWTWDITFLKGPLRGAHYYLYVVLDIYSRYVVGWMLADRECQHLAEQLLRQTCHNQGIEAGQLCLHADRGASMKSQSVETLLLKLGVKKSHSRPHVSDDNPFSEAAFKTLKYSPLFPSRFLSLSEAEAFCQEYFAWYNGRHHHTGLALLTPAQVHYGDPVALLSARHQTLLTAYEQNPARFGYRPPQLEALAAAVYINPPDKTLPEAEA